MSGTEDAPPSWEAWFEQWRRTSGPKIVGKALRGRELGWIQNEEAVALVGAAVWEFGRTSEIRSFDAVATVLAPRVLTDLQLAGRRPSRAKHPVKEVATDFTSRGGEGSRGVANDRTAIDESSNASLTDADLAFVLDDVRAAVSAWLTSATRSGDRDARFGDPFDRATALLYVSMFSEHPLTERFWPIGFPVPDLDLATAELHLRVALWLTDREWFGPEPGSEAEKKRLRRASGQLHDLARSLAGDGAEP